MPASPAPERWRRAKEIFLDASALDLRARSPFLDRECAGDPELRGEVERLLDATVSRDFLAEPVVQRPAPAAGMQPGSLVGHFRIEAPIGRGGGGTVYRATDIELNRSVAIKMVGSGELDAAGRLRFAREAMAASALNHPNIATVYQTGHHGDRDYIVMEFVEGSTLHAVLASKPLPLAKALRIAIEAADALATAHEAGIVHRDLKPGNIMITDRGHVKVLDFGLAKIMPGSQQPDAGEPLTASGTLLGTFAFMSPEQAEGKPVDARSDIFSFGCVLYQMVTRQRAFHEDSDMKVLAAVLNKQPRPVRELAPDLPRDVERVVDRCLAKDLRERWQSMADVKVLLEQALANLESPPEPVAAKRGWFGAPLVAGLAAGALLGGFGLWQWMSRSTPAAREPMVTMLTADTGLSAYPALSKDGAILAYASDRGGKGNLDIWVQQIGGRAPIQLTQWESDESDPDISPDGTHVAFRSEKDGGGVWVSGTFGGEPILVAPGGRNPRFSPDGKWIAYWTGREGGDQLAKSAEAFVIPSGGGQAAQIRPDFAAVLYPVWSPGGESLLVIARKDPKAPPRSAIDWWVTPLEGGEPVQTGALALIEAQPIGLATGQYQKVPLHWIGSPDRILFAGMMGDAANIWEVRLKGGKAVGVPARVTHGAGFENQAAVAPSRLAFSSLSLNFDIWTFPLDAETGQASGELSRLTTDASLEWWPSISWDGKRVAYSSRHARTWSLRVTDVSAKTEATLLSGSPSIYDPRISGDGGWVAYNDLDGSIFRIPARGGKVESLCEKCGTVADAGADGASLLFEPLNPPEDVQVLRVGRSKPSVLAPAKNHLAGAKWSRDGQWVAFHETEPESGNSRIYVARAGGGSAQPGDRIAVTDGQTLDREPSWSRGGNLLYFLSERDGFRCVWGQRLDPQRKTPSGDAFGVRHFHSARRSLKRVGNRMSAIGFSASGNRAVLALGELTGNVWLRQERP